MQLYRRPTGPIVTVFRDGRRETAPGPSGERLHWQIDTGHFFRHPTLGPLWYQKMGWSCVPDDSVLGQLCGQVRP